MSGIGSGLHIPGLAHSPTNLPLPSAYSPTAYVLGHAAGIAERKDELDALDWCRAKNARVRFMSNGKVEVFMNNSTRRRKTFLEAVNAHRGLL